MGHELLTRVRMDFPSRFGSIEAVFPHRTPDPHFWSEPEIQPWA